MRNNELTFLEFTPHADEISSTIVRLALKKVEELREEIDVYQTTRCTHPNGSVHIPELGLHQCTYCGYVSRRSFNPKGG